MGVQLGWRNRCGNRKHPVMGIKHQNFKCNGAKGRWKSELFTFPRFTLNVASLVS